MSYFSAGSLSRVEICLLPGALFLAWPDSEVALTESLRPLLFFM